LVADWTFRGLEQPALLCMTDALGHWLLSQRDHDSSPIGILRRLRTPGAFARLVQEERAAGRMKRDATTLIALWSLDHAIPAERRIPRSGAASPAGLRQPAIEAGNRRRDQ